MDPFLNLAERQMSSPVKARLRAAEARQSLREQQRDDEQHKLSVHYQLQRERELTEALARPDADKLQALIDQLDRLTLETIPKLAAFVCANGWHSAAANTLFLARRLASESITRAREKRGLAPFDDPLPGDPTTPEWELRAAFVGSSERLALDKEDVK